jgi:hypothetical protein
VKTAARGVERTKVGREAAGVAVGAGVGGVAEEGLGIVSTSDRQK